MEIIIALVALTIGSAGGYFGGQSVLRSINRKKEGDLDTKIERIPFSARWISAACVIHGWSPS